MLTDSMNTTNNTAIPADPPLHILFLSFIEREAAVRPHPWRALSVSHAADGSEFTRAPDSIDIVDAEGKIVAICGESQVSEILALASEESERLRENEKEKKFAAAAA